MKALTVSLVQARRFVLSHHGLSSPYSYSGKAGVLRYIRQAGCIQYDPIDIVGTNPELVLQSRVEDFRPELLHGLLYADRKLVDGWDKNMSIYPVEDWPRFRRRRDAARLYWGGERKPSDPILSKTLAEIEERGPLTSSDLDFAGSPKYDWAWAPTSMARAALESLFFRGELVVAGRKRSRKSYDLARRRVPLRYLDAPDPNASEEDYDAWYVARRIGSVGLLWNKPSDAWLGIAGLKGERREAAFARLLDRDEIVPVEVEGVDAPLYARRRDRKALIAAAKENGAAARAAILAPLDNLLWDRRLIRALFGFDYTWEIYKPVHQRKHGYYVLPVLYGDRFVARFEPGRDRKRDEFIVKNWWWEDGVKPTKTMEAALGLCFRRFTKFLGDPELVLGASLRKRRDLDFLK